ncbi:MAG: glycosyltransferase family A protein [Bacteroidota bacterium]|nr:glycosyltransferase family A protein [Bacteroidota bacterium]
MSTCRPFFSVIITTFNRANLITRAINSLIAQIETDWEAIIVDDESTDNTCLHLLPYLSLYPKIKYVRQKHLGVALSKNTGIFSAQGRFITFLDSDDEYYPSHLLLRKEIFIQNPSVKFLYGGVKIIGNQYVPDRFNYNKKIKLSKCAIGAAFFIDRRTAISLNGFNDISLGTDADLFDRAQIAGIPMMKVNKATYIYHHEVENSITNGIKLKFQRT